MRRYNIFALLLFVLSCGAPSASEPREPADATPDNNTLDRKSAKGQGACARVVQGNLGLHERDLQHIAAFVSGVKGFPMVPYAQTAEYERFVGDIPVVRLARLPDYILKCEQTELDARRRVSGAMRAREVCTERGLDKIVIPASALVEVCVEGALPKYIVAEAFLDLETGHEAQRLAFESAGPELEQIVEQLTIVACHSDFRDVRWDNMPLFEHEGSKKMALIDTEPTSGREMIDGFVDWGGDGYHKRTPALIGSFPAYAENIVRVARQELPGERFAALESHLRRALEKATRIRERDVSIAHYHHLRGIDDNTPALDIKAVEALLTPEESDQQGGLRAALEDINAVVTEQGAKTKNVIRAREWRLTKDAYTVDSDFKENIQDSFRFLRQLIPRMAEAGLIHSYLTRDEAVAAGIDIRREGLNSTDYIVQF